MSLRGINRTLHHLLPSLFCAPHDATPRSCRSSFSLQPTDSLVWVDWTDRASVRQPANPTAQFVAYTPVLRAGWPTVVSTNRFFPCSWTAAPAPEPLVWNRSAGTSSTRFESRPSDPLEQPQTHRLVHRDPPHGEAPERDTRSWWLALLLGFLFLLRVLSL